MKSLGTFSHEELSQFLCDLTPVNKISSDLAVLWFRLKADGKFQGEADLMPAAFTHSTEKGIRNIKVKRNRNLILGFALKWIWHCAAFYIALGVPFHSAFAFLEKEMYENRNLLRD